jgi:23S rRNA pseudouridine1911/1915/1917 synthase
MEQFKFAVDENGVGIRLDKFLTQQFSYIKPEINRTKIQHLLDENLIMDEKNQPVKTASQKTKLGQEFVINIEPVKTSHLEAKEIPFEIIFEDEDLLVINKPAGLTVHPGAGNQDNTLVNALLFTHQNRLSNSPGGDFRPGIVHRLDKDTSGLMLVAKNDLTHQILSEKLRLREVKRSYIAFIYGVMNPKKGMINRNIVRSRSNRLKMTVSQDLGRNAVTHYETKKVFFDGFISAVECRLDTGRTHQIRVHLESEKHSLVGDYVYSGSKKTAPLSLDIETKNFIKKFPRQALHSYKISFFHPKTAKEMTFEIPLPEDMQELENILKGQILKQVQDDV